jgi:hypothetical protein
MTSSFGRLTVRQQYGKARLASCPGSQPASRHPQRRVANRPPLNGLTTAQRRPNNLIFSMFFISSYISMIYKDYMNTGKINNYLGQVYSKGRKVLEQEY